MALQSSLFIQGNTESSGNLERKFIFQIDSLNPKFPTMT